MALFFHFIGRLVVICFALIIALFAGSMFIGFGLATGMFPELAFTTGSTPVFDLETDQTILTAATVILGAIASVEIVGLAILPITIAIAITELMQWRTMTVQLVIGGLCALFVMFTALGLPIGAMPANGTVIVSLATGFVSAFFYWLIAGRSAGRWLSSIADNK